MEQNKTEQNKISYNNFDKSTILIVVVLFMFSSKLLDIAWDIGKALVYIILIVYFLNYLNPDIANKIKEIINDFINFDTNGNIFKDIVSKISFTILNIFKPSNIKEITEEKKVQKAKNIDEIQYEFENIKKINTLFDSGIRTLENKENSLGRKLA